MSGILATLTLYVALPLSWYVAWRLWRLSHARPQSGVLRERAGAAVILALIVTVFSFVFVNNDLSTPFLSPEDTRVLTRGTLFVLSVVASFRWLWLYRGVK